MQQNGVSAVVVSKKQRAQAGQGRRVFLRRAFHP